MTLFAGVVLAGTVVLNEVCYDPAGSDAGKEYIELYNPGSEAVSLAGARVDFANGAEGVVWRTQWTGAQDSRIEPQSCFLLADEGWEGPPPDAVANLNLQNGPDAVRLVLPTGEIDLLGYGDLTEALLYEGAPAPAATAGRVLARRPDGRDTDDNAHDFTIAEPSPGAVNFPAYDLLLLRSRAEPPSLLGVEEPVTLSVRLRNRGTEDIIGAAVRLVVGTAEGLVGLPPLAAAAETTISAVVQPRDAGRIASAIEVTWPDGSGPWRQALPDLQVGPAWCCLNEVMAAPAGGGEWVEILNIDVSPRSLAALVLRDEDGAWRALPDVVVAPGACAVVAQDVAAFRAWWDERAAAGAPLGCDEGLFPAGRVNALEGGWPNLNDTPPAGRAFAERVYLGDADGTVLDHVTLTEGAAAQRRSWERVDVAWVGPRAAGWRPATSPAGSTPTCPNSVSLAGGAAAGLTASPNPFSRAAGSGSTHLRFAVPGGAQGWRLRIYDLWGRLVRDLGGDDLGVGVRDVLWDGRDDAGRAVAASGYVVAVTLVGAGGGVVSGARRLVVVREGAP